MSFNGYDLAEEYPYELEAGGSRIVQNIQFFGKSLPALIAHGYFLRLTRNIAMSQVDYILSETPGQRQSSILCSRSFQRCTWYNSVFYGAIMNTRPREATEGERGEYFGHVRRVF